MKNRTDYLNYIIV